MNRSKESVVLILSLCLAASMCACSKSEPAEEITSSDTTAATTEETTEEETEEPEESEDTSLSDVERVEGTGETLLGFDDWYLERIEGQPGFNTWTFYNSDGEPFAEQFGFNNDSGPQYYVDDFDGDGEDDIICNNRYGGDGAQRVFVFRNNGGTVEVGRQAVSGELCVLGYNLFYDPETGVVTFINNLDGTEEILTSDDFIFVPYDEARW